MSINFLNTVTINNRVVNFKELKIKHLKVLYKSLIGDEPNPAVVFNNIDNILCDITDLTKQEIQNLSIIEYFLLLFELRCTSIGDTIFAELTDKTNTKIEININNFIKILNQINYEDLITKDTIEGFDIIYKIPTVNECLDINKNLDNIPNYFVSKIIRNPLSINFINHDTQTIQKILEQLPAKLTANIFKKAIKIMEHFNKTNLLANTLPLKDKTLGFNFNVNNLIFLLKLVFGDQLMSLYDNIFLLCKQSNFTPDYIENCTPGEYYLYLKKLEMLAPKQTIKEVNTPQNDLDPFSDLPPITSRSEFTP